MRLTTIKLAGFKSFVDPTTLHLPTNMTGVVGPNGCGKSNIIDAIRWVMGESAASRLRGDSLTDVIFSGSTARKPVGQAMVELIFDNADGTVQGEYAAYSEISVKRTVTRDGQSQYYLNGTRCRRRDITDLFLGTGLGPRSYSIIEQGVISQIIEAKPEQLRIHLEEAAGISKYKERRKETESRIRATRENLDRVNDVREEVDKQLEHLNRQARAAERWTALKEEQAHKEAELHALDYRALRQQQEEQTRKLSQAQTEIEKFTADQRQSEARLEEVRERHQGAGEHLNEVQGEVYKVGAEIARIEQQAQHNRELAERLHRARDEARREHEELSGHISADREQAETLRQYLAEGSPQQETLQQAREATAEAQSQSEARLADWQTRWDTHTRDAAQVARAADVERTRLDYLDRQAVENKRRQDALASEAQAFDMDALEAAAVQMQSEHEQQGQQVETLNALMDEHKGRHEQLQQEERQLQAALNESRQEAQTTRGRLASLQALQAAALGQDDAAVNAWLERLGLDRSQRLGTQLHVDEGWERAVETVLTGVLDAVLVDEPQGLAGELAQLEADMALMKIASSGRGSEATLAAHAEGPAAALALLGQVFTADSLEQAQARLPSLAAGQSVITGDGTWLAAGWARIHKAGDGQTGILAREREITSLAERQEQLEARIAEAGERLETLRADKAQAEQSRDEVQRQLYTAHRRLSELAGQLQSHRGKAETARARSEKVRNELSELEQARQGLESQTSESRAGLDEAVTGMARFEDQRRELEGERRALLEAREEARMNAREAAEQAHALALGIESRRTALASLEQALQRMDTQQQQLQARREQIEEQLAQGDTPIAELETERQACLDQRLLLDKQLVEARRALEELEAEYRQLDQQRQTTEQTLTGLREKHAEQRLAVQALDMRASQQAEAITAAGQELESLLEALPEHLDPAQRKQELESLAARITRLEPVNLAAIQEYEEQSQRKVYLDSQVEDLSSALETLEGAIRKIDRETRQLFKETFDKVNLGVQELFPRLFGGGHAYLELTGEDLLDTGVAIMARPPGKRITNISLLSGGEKAMSAVALVFAIFRLNPAPFCLLDEVDAPLDEANVGRFSSMVSEMSEHVQFIFISHNKSTMEAARQLCGVTMREPGVSRLVQVDLAEASRLAGAA